MTELRFEPARKEQSKLRMGIYGPSNSGKTYTALTIATVLGEKVALINTDPPGSADKYADKFKFDRIDLPDHHPETYSQAINLAIMGGYDALVVDTLSHAWRGRNGILELVDQATQAARSGNAFTSGWSAVSPIESAFWQTLLAAPLHIICTLRVKTKYVLEANERGKQVPRKVGLEPIQREGVEYEFDVLGEMDMDHVLTVDKSRYPEELPSGELVRKPNREWALKVKDAIAAGDAPEVGEDADPALVMQLMEVLAKEGRDSRKIMDALAARKAENGGVLTPEWVADEIAKAEARLAGGEARAAMEEAEAAAAAKSARDAKAEKTEAENEPAPA